MTACSYPSNWKKVSLIIRRLAGGCCQLCGYACENLSVHHLGVPYADGRPGNKRDKHDLRRENLVAVCFSCHDGLDHLRKHRQEYKQRNVKRQVRRDLHRSLNVGTGLVLWSPARAVSKLVA